MPRVCLWVIAVCSVVAAGLGGVVLCQNDFAITEERVEIPGSAHPLHAILALPPRGEKPYGLVVFVHGDGPADASRDSFYRPLWESFARAGYASVSWNKPGVEGAPGNWLSQSMHDRAVETEAVLAWAKRRGDIDPRRIGVWGISQGGWVLPEVATRHPELQFMILVGPAINWLRQGEYNLLAELRARKAGDSEIAAAGRRRAESVRLLRADADYGRYLASGIDDPPMSADRWRFVHTNYLSDVTPQLAGIKIPVLLILGADDRNVDVAETERVYRAQLPPNQLTVQLFPNASHSIAKASLDHDQGIGSFLVAVFAPRSLYASGYLDSLRKFVEDQPERTVP
ncbi:S9 family peptidase [Mycolicibacterium sp. HK-90]|uniref:alpha/beta hydrolase family protein n=1 Tax=Mycolicibacterium sp. HK-90 TaxID=3056937 RepID=UPI00265A3EA2|nr:alpha/beta fold hydrolase [Mycolicibacterium sp. HK-90]WKG02980.1 alpha/beta fold hydrolase [Mycolicibacterium sp. HK-90]